MKKIITFSFDDGVRQDARLAELFNKYGMRATFNLNSGLLGKDGKVSVHGVDVAHNKVMPSEVRDIYRGHEVAAHTLTHPLLPSIDSRDEIIRQVEGDRLALSDIVGYEVVGFAYPCGGTNFDHRVSEIIKNDTGIKYARTIRSCEHFGSRENVFEYDPTVHSANFERLFALADKFIDLNDDGTHVFYVWGHSYEFDVNDGFAKFEKFLQKINECKDIVCLTNREVLAENEY